MPGPKFENGESVYGLWPGSGGLYFKGTIVAVDEDFATYDVKFEEGTVYTLLSKHVKPVDSFKSQEPKTTQVRRRGRSSSASRSRSRSRTPGRKPRDPSPIRKTKEPSPIIKTRRPGRPSKQVTKKKEEEKQENNIKVLPDEIDEMSLSKRQSSIPTNEGKAEEEIQSRRRSARIATKVEAIKNETTLTSIAETNSNGKTEIKDPENKDVPEEQESNEKVEILPVQTNTITSLLTAVGFPVLVVFLHLICQTSECNLPSWNSLLNWSQWANLYDPITFIPVATVYLCIIFLSLLPFGKVTISDRYVVSYRRNALLILLAICPLAAAKHYTQSGVLPAIPFIPKLLVPVMIVSLIFALIVLWITRRNGTESGAISKFVVGVSTDIYLGSLSAKSILNRLTAVPLILINFILIEADYERKKTMSPTVLLGALMQIIYGFYHLWDEAEILRTMTAGRLKLGWSLINAVLFYPFLVSLITIYNTNYKAELPFYCLAPIGILFIEGLFIKIGSNKQKAAFMNNPENPSFANAESLPTSSGQKLLVSGWWGWVRHPTLLGDIVIHWAFALVCGFHVALPYLVTVVITVALLVRVYADDRISGSEFGPSWDRYCQRVTSRVLPRIL